MPLQGGMPPPQVAESAKEDFGNDDDAACNHCGGDISYDDNPIVFCDICNVAVHQQCYEITRIPDGKWFCKVCEARLNPEKVKCVICLHTGGAMKPTTCGSWCHTLCAAWIPETRRDKMRPELIDVSSLNSARNSLKCIVCNKKKAGACIQCPQGRCTYGFHPYCLVHGQHNFFIPPGQFMAYCKRHSQTIRGELMGEDGEEGGGGGGFLTALGSGSGRRSSTGRLPRGGPMGNRGHHKPPGAVTKMYRRGSSGMPLLGGNVDFVAFTDGDDGSTVGGNSKSMGGQSADRYRGDDGTVASRASGTGGNAESVQVPLFSEWDQPMYSHDLDMDHFWACVAWYFPEDQPAEVLARLREAILPATGPEDPIFRVPKPRRAGRGEESVGTGGGGDSVYGGGSDNEDGSLSDGSYETDEHEEPANLPLVLHRDAKGPGGNGAAPASNVIVIDDDDDDADDEGGKKGLDGEEEKRFSVGLAFGQLLAACELHVSQQPGDKEGEERLAAEIVPIEYAKDREGAFGETTLQVDMSCPSEMDLQLLTDQRKLASLSVSLRDSVDRMLVSMNANRPALESQKQAEHRVIQRYHVARVWKQLALGLERGVQDHTPDWNKTKLEEIPASWAIPVPGRPTPEDFAIKAKAAGAADVEEEDSVCMVCMDGSVDEANQIMYCDGCNAALHQACYGVHEVPGGDFYCDRCMETKKDRDSISASRDIRCAICYQHHGGFKATTDRRWVHLFCALLAPQTVIHNLRDMDMIDISAVPIQARTRKQAGGSAANTPSSRAQALTPRAAAAALPSLRESLKEDLKEETNAPAEAAQEEEEHKPAAVQVEQAEEGKEGKTGKEDKEEKEDTDKPPAMEVCGEEGPSEASEAKPTAEGEGEGTQDAQPPATETAIVPAAVGSPSKRQSKSPSKPSLTISTSPCKIASPRASPGKEQACPLGACVYCRDKAGFTHVCSHEGCEVHFHALCAWFKGACMQLKVLDKTYLGDPESGAYPAGVEFKAYCSEHSPGDRTEQMEIRKKYRLPEMVKTLRRRKWPGAPPEGVGRSMGLKGQQRKELPPDQYHDKYACAMCLKPLQTLLPSRPDLDPPQPTMQCSKCGLAVHKSCHEAFHGPDLLPKPDETWTCVSCLAITNNLVPTPGIVTPALAAPEPSEGPAPPDEPAPQLACVLCPRRGGLFVPTNDRNPRFAHAFCAAHCSHLGVTRSHRDVTLPHTASVQVEQLPKDVRRAKCNICSRKGPTVCVQCSVHGCSYAVHPLCAKLAGWLFRTATLDAVHNPKARVFELRCPHHTPEGIVRAMNGEYVDHKAVLRLRMNLDRGRLLLDTVRKREKVKRNLAKAEATLSSARLAAVRSLLEARLSDLQEGKELTDERRDELATQLDVLKPGDKPPVVPPSPAPTEPDASGVKAEAGGVKRKRRITLEDEETESEDEQVVVKRRVRKKEVEEEETDDEDDVIIVGVRQRRQSAKAAEAAAIKAELNGSATIMPKPAGRGEPVMRGGKATGRGARTGGQPMAPPSPPPTPTPRQLKKEEKEKKKEEKERKRQEKEKKKAAREQEEEEEEDEDEYGLTDAFEDVSEEYCDRALEALAKQPAWIQAARRLEPVRVDFEKSLTNLLNPETLRKREGRYKSEATECRIALDQRLMEYITMLEDLQDPNDAKEKVSDTFDLTPDPRVLPQYYDAISLPMDLETLRHRVQTFFYHSVEEFAKDVTQMVRNAKRFNNPSSLAHHHAVVLGGAFEALKQKLYDRDRDIQAAAAGLRIGSKRRLKLGTLSDSEDTTDGAASGASMADASGGSGKGGRGKGGVKRGGNHRSKSLGSVCDLCRGVEASKARRFCQSCVEGQWNGFLRARVQVFWRADRKWYDGTIQDYDARTGKHRIWYDDGDWEFVRLSEQTLRFLTPVELKSRVVEVVEEGGEGEGEGEEEGQEAMQVDEEGKGDEEGQAAAGKEDADAAGKEREEEEEQGEGEAEGEDSGKKRRKEEDDEVTVTDESVGTTSFKGGAIKLKRIERLLQEEGNFRAAEGGERHRKQPERFG